MTAGELQGPHNLAEL